MSTSLVGNLMTFRNNTTDVVHSGTFPAGTVPVGDLVLVRFNCNAIQGAWDTIAVTDSKGNTYNNDLIMTQAGGTGGIVSGAVGTAILGGDTMSISITLGGTAVSCVLACIVEQVHGVDSSSSRIDTMSSGTTASGQGTAFTSGACSTDYDDMFIAGVLCANNGSGTPTADVTPWLTGPVATFNTTPTVKDVYSFYKIQTAHVVHTLFGPFTTNSASLAGIVTYRASGATLVPKGTPPVGAQVC